MATTKQRVAGLLCGGALALGLAVGGAATASADDNGRHHDGGRCSVSADDHGKRLNVKVRSDQDRERAKIEVNYNEGRDQDKTIRLNGNGDGNTSFQIPRRADWATVKVTIDQDHGRDVKCEDRVRISDHDHNDHGGREYWVS